MLASVLVRLANSIEMLVAARIMQGAVAGPMIPLSQAMLLAVYPPERRVSALSLGAMVAIIAPVMGPLLGGWISDNWGWRWIFLINVPVGLVAAVLTMRVFKRPRNADGERADRCDGTGPARDLGGLAADHAGYGR